jgi:putative NIF3 family GTP cyclohydrolase 1 type 2
LPGAATFTEEFTAGKEDLVRAKDVLAYLRSLNGGWLDLERTVDTFKSGDPEAEVRGIAVSWMSTTEALRAALEAGCTLFVTHEPTYYDHHDDHGARVFDYEGTRTKRAAVEESGITIIRCHDLWDQMPAIGIPDAWGEALSLGPAIGGEGYYRVYDVSGETAGDVARQVAARTVQYGQEAVQLIGDPETPVHRVAIGTGAITPLFGYIHDFGEAHGLDLAICTDDGFTYWREGAYALDTGLPVIIVNHATAEEPGMMRLAERLATQFPDVPVRFIPRGCIYRLVTGDE